MTILGYNVFNTCQHFGLSMFLTNSFANKTITPTLHTHIAALNVLADSVKQMVAEIQFSTI